MMDKILFRDRFFDFWLVYNPTKCINDELIRAANKYYSLLTNEKIDFPTTDRVLSLYEKENSELPYNFNIAAYIIDFRAMERLEAVQNSAILDKLPIVLPIIGRPIRVIDKPKLAEAVDKIRKTCPSLYRILERINVHRLRMPYEHCYACDDTGMISFSVFTEHGSRKKIKKYHQSSDKADYTVAMRCTCSKGSAMSQKIPSATVDECVEIARLNQY